LDTSTKASDKQKTGGNALRRLRLDLGCNATAAYIGCPTTYQTRQFFNNSKTNEDIATRFE